MQREKYTGGLTCIEGQNVYTVYQYNAVFTIFFLSNNNKTDEVRRMTKSKYGTEKNYL